MKIWRKLQGSTSLDDLQKVLPAVDADMNDSSKDGEFAKYDGASVLLNHVALNKTVKTSDTASYTPDDLSYRVRINFYDANPDDASAEMIGSPSDLKNLQYAEVVATGFINRYKDGRTAGNTKSPQAMKRAVCRIEAKTDSTTTNHSSTLGVGGRMGMGFMPRRPTTGSIRSSYGYPWIMMACPSDPIQPAKLNSPARWIPDTPIPASCPMALRRESSEPHLHAGHHHSGYQREESIAENLDLSKSPQAGSGWWYCPPHTTREVTPTNIRRNAVLTVRTPH